MKEKIENYRNNVKVTKSSVRSRGNHKKESIC